MAVVVADAAVVTAVAEVGMMLAMVMDGGGCGDGDGG
jgi:hypothetical protein